MTNEEDYKKEREELDKRHRQESLELSLKHGKAYRCSDCGEITIIPYSGLGKHYVEKGKCYRCYLKAENEWDTTVLKRMILGGTIIDAGSHPQSGYNTDIQFIVIEKDGKLFTLQPFELTFEHDQKFPTIRLKDGRVEKAKK